MKRVRLKDNLTGFTLIELLLAITLFCIIAVAIYSSLAAGLNVHKKGNSIGGVYNDLKIALNRIGMDFRTAVCMNNIYLIEDSQKVYFYSIQQGQKGTKEICRITYSWEREKDYFVLLRLKESYIDSLQGEHSKGDELLDEIKSIGFDYGYIKKSLSGEEEFQWKQNWREEFMPKLVRLNLEIPDGEFTKVVYCPAGKMAEVKEE